MDQKQTIPMTPFDNLISNEHLQMMKLMLPYMPPGSQKIFAVYVKFLELQHTMNFFQNFHTEAGSLNVTGSHPSPMELFRDIQPYMNAKDSETISQMMQMLEMFRGFQNMSGTEANPLSMMMGMLSPDQKAAFETYSEMFSNMDSQSVTSQEIPDSAPPPDITPHATPDITTDDASDISTDILPELTSEF